MNGVTTASHSGSVAGTVTVNQPFQGGSFKLVTLTFTGYTDSTGYTAEFSDPFDVLPGSTTLGGVALSALTKSSVHITSATNANGAIILFGI